MALLVDLNNELFDVFSCVFLSYWFHDNDKHFVPIQTDIENLKKNKGKTIYILELSFRAIFNDIREYVIKRLNNSIQKCDYIYEITSEFYNLRECIKTDIIPIRGFNIVKPLKTIDFEYDYDLVIDYIYEYHVKQLFNLLEIISDYENEESH